MLEQLGIERSVGRQTANELNYTSPEAMKHELARVLGDRVGRLVITGTMDRRLIIAEDKAIDRWHLADLSGAPHSSREWPAWTAGRIEIDNPERSLSLARVTPDGVRRLTRPRMLLTALYHPEHFPLPRFPLGISDLARAARATLLGEVRLLDMQLGVTVEDILEQLHGEPPEILGISATFGQHDLMVRLLDEAYKLPRPPMVLAGGSLTARNEKVLLEQFPELLIARGAGEPTVQDILGLWHGDFKTAEVRGIGYHGAARGAGTMSIGSYRRTASVSNRLQTDYFPELDLLEDTFRHRGVAQLEGSRGCTNYCSFCPRGHKGTWAGAVPENFPWLLQEMRRVFDKYPEVSRTLYFVDEEFIGRGSDAVPRALSMAKEIHRAGFSWETSCRIDQVVMPENERSWHIERGSMWRELVQSGLRRCLFGIESGVSSILQRFNKETTGEQNALGIRTLSALGVPTRFTYITFDPLMSLHELEATHAFQGRTDLLLKPLPHLSVEEIADGVRDEDFVRKHSRERPFYQTISYMMVSMECLIGAAYTNLAQAAGLTGNVRPSMGRVDSRFLDWRIGRSSLHAQMWVDRNFALDYTLKSLEKIHEGEPRRLAREARVVIKDAAFSVFTDMLSIIGKYSPDVVADDKIDADLRQVMDSRLGELAGKLGETVRRVASGMPEDQARLMKREYRQWQELDGWRLINAGDNCD
ncbi:B12-binding domain-containing radical SAM protein [Micromonospora sp. NPDC093277]|uniref:B12-binding domain-containing radical SAM protein n=1 Tax=Micromonospora sp. NPDC093277 TaxID=3364291 RepID=UPI00382A5486